MFGASRFLVSIYLLIGLTACAITATRPTQEMSNTVAAIRAAKEVRADLFAPELYRQSREWFFKAKNAFKFKEFEEAEIYANKARILAEWAEFEAIRNGGTRDQAPPDPLDEEEPEEGQASGAVASDEPAADPGDAGYEPPEEIYYESYEREQNAKRQQQQQQQSKAPPPAPKPKP